MKWTVNQILLVVLIAVSMWLLEYTSEGNMNQPVSGEWTAVNTSYGTFFMIALVLMFFYLILLVEARKKDSFLNHSVWRMMPVICAVVGVLSVILFILGGTVGPIMEWVEQWRFLLYVFLVYFLFLVFLFIFSVEHKRQPSSRKNETTVHVSFAWTLLLFFVLFFLL